MKQEEVIQIIYAGFTPARFFKRSAWTKIERVMEFLTNKGLIVKTTNSDVKYTTRDGIMPNESAILNMAKAYCKSPLLEHYEAMRRLSAETGLPVNSYQLLAMYNDTKLN